MFGQHQAVGIGPQLLQVQPAAPQSEPIPVRAGAQQDSHQPLRCHLHQSLPIEKGQNRIQPLERTGGEQRQFHALGDVGVDLPLLTGLAVRGQHRLRGLDEHRRTARREHDRQVVALEHRRAGQDVVGVPVGFVDVEVQGDKQIQLAQRRLQRPAVGHREHRVAGQDEKRPKLTLTGCGDLLGHHRGGERAVDVGQIADARMGLGVAEVAGPLTEVLERDDRVRHQGAAGAVEVAGDQRQGIEQKADQGAVVAQAGTGAAVGGGAGRGREVTGQRPDLLGARAGAGCGGFRSEGGAQVSQHLGAGGLALDRRRVLQAVGEDHLQHGQQKPGVGVGFDGDVLVDASGFGAARIDHDHPAAAAHDRGQVVFDARRASAGSRCAAGPGTAVDCWRRRAACCRRSGC